MGNHGKTRRTVYFVYLAMYNHSQIGAMKIKDKIKVDTPCLIFLFISIAAVVLFSILSEEKE